MARAVVASLVVALGVAQMPTSVMEAARAALAQKAAPQPYRDGGSRADGGDRLPAAAVNVSPAAQAAARAREAPRSAAATARARRELARIDALGALAVAGAAPARNASGRYQKPAAPPAPLAAMLAAASRWAHEACAARDPGRVREHLGMKGVKHFTEWLDLQRLAVAAGDADALARVHDVVPAVLGDARYHAWVDFPRDSWRFRQDSMSYLRAHYLCAHTELGFQKSHPALMRRWRRTIEATIGDVWAHLESRGLDQRLNFVKLFRGLGLYAEGAYLAAGRDETTGEGLAFRETATFASLPTARALNAFEAEVFEATTIRARVEIGWFLASPDRPYDITHEIFALTADGQYPFPFLHAVDVAFAVDRRGALVPRPPPDDASRGHYAYALQTTLSLLKLHVARDAVDVVCEYVVNLGQLGVRARRADDGTAAYRVGELYLQGRDYVASRRNADGTFGETYDAAAIRRAKGNPRYDVDVGGTLHTTYVCLWALGQPVYDDDAAQSSWAGATHGDEF